MSSPDKGEANVNIDCLYGRILNVDLPVWGCEEKLDKVLCSSSSIIIDEDEEKAEEELDVLEEEDVIFL